MSAEQDKTAKTSEDWPDRWNSVLRLLERKSALFENFSPGKENLENIHNVKVLVVGAGGLGCELLKDLALSGFRDIHVIDMDTIDISNLNRQFLFRLCDVGKPKAVCAAEFVNKRVKGCKVTPHFCKIQDKDEEFYRSFGLVICGLDSIVARRWINAMIFQLLEYDDDMDLVSSSVKPIIDGGTEGFLGNARVIIPTVTPCIECTVSLYPPQVNFPMCTIAHTPRLPEHCVEYVRIILWEKEKPFGDTGIDGDDPKHISWIYEESKKRAEEYGIKGVTYRLTQGVIKHIIPAVASTNAVIAAACALEAFKLAASCANPLNNYMNFQQTEGVYVGVVELEKKDDCLACSQKPQRFTFSEVHKLQDVIKYLVDSPDYMMKSPSIHVAHPKTKVLYQANIPDLEAKTKGNLRRTLKELGLEDGQEMYVADVTTPQTLTFQLQLTAPMDHS